MATNYTGDPTQVRAPGPAPISFDDPVISVPAGGDARNAASVEQMVKHLADYVAALRNMGVTSLFGDGSAGDYSGSGPNLNNDKFYDNLKIGRAHV